ncbi:hypothetical protein KO500_07485 [Cellulophaga baltica]|uniref:hypothetical protein n=1 Tax=Cellulophaga TaxID=104264 RepID=UPI001C0757BC|nr:MULTISPECIES: hypothetical protein [Cellulophaga]MBU2996271.1 hypothetical protein [Cellulophaga baltica]MDO6767666.1 hypothetical protein [Cellulophaga sp. 1_MG-2023]
MNFLKNIFSKKTEKNNANISNEELLKGIFNTKTYKDGNTCFHFASRNFFSLVDNNGEIKKSEYGDNIIAVNDFNGDQEPYETLFFSNENEEVRIRFFGEKSFKVSNSLYDLFNIDNPEENFVKRGDSEYWSWYEESFNSSKIQNKIHKCVFPNLDLPSEIQNNFNSFVSGNQEFDVNSFSNFFTHYDNYLSELIPSNFSAFNGFDSGLKKLINEINISSKKNKFKIIEFNPSGNWGIIELNSLEKTEIEKLENYGLMIEQN